MHDEPTQIKVTATTESSWIKNLAVNIRGAGAVIVIVAWFTALTLVGIFVPEASQPRIAFALIGFMGFYLGMLGR